MQPASTYLTPCDIRGRLVRALNKFREKEQELIRVNASERSMTHRLALYIEEEFPGWSVDCEYNRQGDMRKVIGKLVPPSVATDADEAVTVFPDIVVHRRGKFGPNLLIIEAKKATSSGGYDFDRAKLRAYRDELDYCCAALVILPAGSRPGTDPEWFCADKC